MPYQIAGIDVHKKMLAVVVPTSTWMVSTSLHTGRSGPVPPNYARSPTGCSNAMSRKW